MIVSASGFSFEPDRYTSLKNFERLEDDRGIYSKAICPLGAWLSSGIPVETLISAVTDAFVPVI